MMSENQSSQARNTLLKDRLQNLKGRGAYNAPVELVQTQFYQLTLNMKRYIKNA